MAASVGVRDLTINTDVNTDVEANTVTDAHDCRDCLHLDPDTRTNASVRLKSAKGHLEGVLRMLDDPDVYCVDVLKQIKAVQGALTKVGDSVLRAHIRDHVATAAQRGDSEQITEELMEALKYRSR
jgi:CsoR family transcriptional regulator, copper-sensing transcriptional repressor